MIQEFVQAWERNKHELEAKFQQKHPEDYEEIVRGVVEILRPEEDEYGGPDPTRVTSIDHGDYQGTLVFVIAETGYQPSTYWYVTVNYGSCSGCDTLQAIHFSYDEEDSPIPTPNQVSQYMTLALHIVQRLKLMDGEAVGEDE